LARPCIYGLCLAFVFLVVPAQTFGDTDRPLLNVVTGEFPLGEGGRPPSGLEGACGVAVDSSADLYASDYYHDAIDIFHVRPTGSGQPKVDYLTRIEMVHPANGPCGLTVDSSGDLFVNYWRHQVAEFRPSSFPPSEATIYKPSGLIDSGPANGVKFDPLSNRVYVDDGTYISEYEPSGAPVQVGGQPLRIGLGTLNRGFGLAISDFPATAGDIYAADAEDRTVRVYDPSVSLGNPIEIIDGSGMPQAGFTYLGESELAVDPVDGHLFVLDQIGHDLSEHPAIAVDEFNDSDGFRGQVVVPSPWITRPVSCINPDPATCKPVAHRFTEAEPSELAIGPYQPFSDALYVSTGNSEAAGVWIFGEAASARELSLTKAGSGGGTVVSEPAGINCGTACTAEYEEEATVTLNALPDLHSDFRRWTVTGPNAEPCPGVGSCTIVVGGNVAVEAEFETAPQKTLSVSVEGEGTVVSNPASISCPGKCSEEFAQGHTVILSAKPEPRNRVLEWSGCSYQPNVRECAVTMSDAKFVGVEFGPIPPEQLTVSVSGPGRVLSYPAGISCPSLCDGVFDEESTTFLIPSPDPGFQFGGWHGGGCGSDAICAVAMDGAESVGARFVDEFPLDEGAPPGSVRPPASLPEPSLHLRKLMLKGGAALAATVSGAGRLSVLSHWLRPTGVEVGAAGTVRVPLVLGGAGEAALLRRRRPGLRVAVTILFMPSYRGTPVTATEAFTFGGKKKS
jgi:hypothetical protein